MQKQPHALKKYQEMEILTSSPAKLILVLYDELIKCLNLAKEEMSVKNIEESHNLLIKSQRIIRELMCSLNLKAGEIAVNLYRLYEYMHYRLVQANLEKDIQMVEEVIDLIKPLREAWIKAMEGVNESYN